MADRLPSIAILGGGVGALTAAFWLSQGEWDEHFSGITVYQQGWRLGGKGASGRRENGQILEHGLHVWFGFYENAFRLMRRCYAELGRVPGSPLATVEDAFKPASTFVVQERRPAGWEPWLAQFPEDDQLPGDLGDTTPLPSLWEYTKRSLSLGLTFLTSALGDPAHVPRAGVTLRVADDEPDVTLRVADERPFRIASRLARVGTDEAAHVMSRAMSTALELAHSLGPDASTHSPRHHALLHELIDRTMTTAKRHLRDIAFETDAGRRSWYLAEIFLAAAKGVLRHHLITHPRGIDAIDDFDFSDWLILNGADDESARSSLITTVAYDLAFAYRDGDPAQPAFSAASGLRGLFRLFFTYRGAIAWKMQAGMGDVVFMPLFQILRKRGVKFEFFHRVTALRPSPDRRWIDSIEMDVQADVTTPGGYDPVFEMKDLPCWPERPRVDQLEGGDRLPQDVDFESFWCDQRTRTRTLFRGSDFDDVVLGISVGALRFVGADLVDQNQTWQRMVDELETVYTQSFQLWLREPVESLLGKRYRDVVSGGHVEPFDTFADMSHLKDRESVPGSEGIAYFTNTMPTERGAPPGADDGDGPKLRIQKQEEAKANAIRYLREDIGGVWPKAVRRYPSDFRWDLLVADDGVTGVDRFDAQFWRANVDPSDRYVLSLPGTLRFRLYPDRSGYENLVLAGDWTRCVLNSGCVESAVISGMLAAHALRPDSPPLEEIVGLEE